MSSVLLLLLACGSEPAPPPAPAGPDGPVDGRLVVDGPDADGDGLSDADEAKAGTDPANPDSDGDGKVDGYEVRVSHTDPLKKDSDGDGAADGFELARGTDPNDPDDKPDLGVPAGPGEPAPAASRLPGAGEPEPPPLQRCTFGKDDLETCYVQVPGGSFLMGAQATDPAAPGYDPEALPDEGPPHRVTVSPTWILRDEVLVSTFSACVDTSVCRKEDVATGGLSTFRETVGPTSGVPITSITWEGARRLCWYLGGRLPTEAEWELAARGTDGRRYPWGDAPGCGTLVDAGFNPDGTRKAADAMREGPCVHEGPVGVRGLFGESPYRLRGMAGNVNEWVLDAYAADAYAQHEPTDPRGPAEGDRRVLRGGGWTAQDPLELRSAGRFSLPPDQRLVDVGVRCVWDGTADAP
ncbi:MAG: SUMF1/EgtB/PvdO family nonheme iron enzyme [Alphaproteobacteria bacterium]|nr:SUMF1/EgtB/PvdO family nonheme iron enzyme [Alphaproteobacteria bacterium]